MVVVSFLAAHCTPMMMDLSMNLSMLCVYTGREVLSIECWVSRGIEYLSVEGYWVLRSTYYWEVLRREVFSVERCILLWEVLSIGKNLLFIQDSDPSQINELSIYRSRWLKLRGSLQDFLLGLAATILKLMRQLARICNTYKLTSVFLTPCMTMP